MDIIEAVGANTGRIVSCQESPAGEIHIVTVFLNRLGAEQCAYSLTMYSAQITELDEKPEWQATTDLEGDCLVYCYIDARSGVPFYIGATDDLQRRKEQHERCCKDDKYCKFLHNKLKKLKREGGDARVVTLLNNLSRDAAFRIYEVFFIASIGRRDQGRGPLCNLTDGGEGVTGLGPEATQKRSAAIKAAFASEMLRQRMSDLMKAAHARPEVRKRHAEAHARSEVRKRRSESAKAASARPDVKRRRSEAMNAVHARPDVKKRLRESQKKAQNREEVRRRKSESQKIVQNREDVRQRIAESNARDDVKRRRSESQKIAQNREDVKQRKIEARRHCPPKGRFKGVRPSGKKWQATHERYIGTYPTEEAAARSYNDAVDQYWGGNGYKNRVDNIPVTVERRQIEYTNISNPA